MQALRRTAVTASRQGRTTLSRQTRRYAHDEHAHAHHAEPVNESFGKGFWVVLSAFPAGYTLYQISRYDPDDRPYFTRIIGKYTDIQEQISERNNLHVRMIEQAGSDRVLFRSTEPNEYVDMRFPEIMSVGSPYNVPAGSQTNISHVIDKYRREQVADEEAKLEAMRNGTLKAEQPIDRLPKGADLRNFSVNSGA
ncbi:hypothetical protein BDV96DRAFT_592588 [Lophiotrema nucula]|uniref:NADH-ubiquinone oxidoreductase subunit n=1 Tax=Lophiotrema nucula TaxID=690887 RepID=A0A6A5YES1_9PLEO|nr:hypothetical protein BDV96DRAFT_592588 [Lophiotrema nucula]